MAIKKNSDSDSNLLLLLRLLILSCLYLYILAYYMLHTAKNRTFDTLMSYYILYIICVFLNLFISDISVKRGQAITFGWDANCEVKGKWKKDGLTLHNGGRITINQSEDSLSFSLTISKATDKDEGEYTLELSNRKGQVSGSAKVKLLGTFLNSTLLELEYVCSL